MASQARGVSGLTGRYASALFELADQQKQLDAVAGDLTVLRDTVASSDDFKRLLGSPVVRREQQIKAIEAIVGRLGVSQLTRNFVGLVARNRRAFVLPQIIDAFLALLAYRRGEVRADITASQPLTPHQIDAVTDQLRRVVGSKVVVNIGIDPQILGGLIVKVGSRLIDASLRTKLHRLQLAMKGI